MRHRTSPSRRHLRDTPRPFSTPSGGRVASTNRRWPRGSLPRHLPFRHHSDRHPALRSRSNSPSPPLARPERHLSLEGDSLGEFQPVDFLRSRPACLQAGVQIAPRGASWRGLRALGFVERAEGSDPNGGQTADSPPRSHALSERVNSSLRSRGRSERHHETGPKAPRHAQAGMRVFERRRPDPLRRTSGGAHGLNGPVIDPSPRCTRTEVRPYAMEPRACSFRRAMRASCPRSVL